MVYPMGEVSTASFLTLLNNISTGVYLIVTIYISPPIMNWLLSICCGACAVALLFFKVRAQRGAALCCRASGLQCIAFWAALSCRCIVCLPRRGGGIASVVSSSMQLYGVRISC